MVTQADLDKIWQWNDIVPAPVERCVHEIIEEQAQKQPSSPAICAWDGDLTYGDLIRLSTRLASRLSSLGVGPDVIVPLCFEKSMWTTVAMLAVLKAGGAFVLLDHSLPEQRLQAIVQQVKPTVVLSSLSNQTLSSQLLPEVVTVGPEVFTDLDNQANGDLQSPSPSSAMYVIFTSGSTGTPKGVVISHGNMASALHYQTKGFGFMAESRIFDFASYGFDVSISNIFTGLAGGACICVPSDRDRRNNLAESIASLRANVIHLTPSVAQFVSPAEVPQLQSIILGGEALRVRDVEPWFGKIRLINTYGPAECTSTSTINYSTSSSPEEATRIGNGAGVVTWVVDPENHDNLLPLGSIGELLLEGPLVGHGYLEDPAKTAVAFIEDPEWLLSLGRRGRLYKTGDLVQYNEDGSLTFVGRKDTQVKIRGQRVELGEVEYRVQESLGPIARQVVAEVIVPGGPDSRPILAAFVKMDDDKSESAGVSILSITADAEAMMSKHLPGHMVPTVFFAIQELPITASGKTDRKGLREIGGSFSAQELAELRTAEQGIKRRPASQAEQQMQKIWSEVLNIGIAAIGLDDSFFRLGGDSIAAMKVVSEARKVGVQLTVADIFDHPTLGDVVSQGFSVADKAPEDILPFSLLGENIVIPSLLQDISTQCQLDPKTTIQDVYPCTPLQEGLLSLSLQRPGDYIMQGVLELSPDIAIDSFQHAWEEVIRTMAILRTRIVQHSDVSDLLQVVLNQEIHWIEATGLHSYLEADKKQPMELGQPLSRYALVRDITGKHKWFVWTVHHVLYDGWSLPLVFDAVNRAYHGDELDVGGRFKSFIKHIGEQDDDKMAEYWRRSLADCSWTPFPELPSSLQQPVADSTMKHQLARIQAPSLDITTSTLIRAAWALVAGRMTNSHDVVFGVTVSGRNAPVADIDKMAGPTIATVPLRVKLESDWSVSGYLEAVQRQATEMIPFEQSGLHRIARLCPDSQQACMFQTLLVIQPQENSSSENVLGKWQHDSQQEQANTYALMLEIQLGGDKITASASFDSRVIEPWAVRNLLGRLEFVMQQLAGANPEQQLREIGTVTPKELEQIWQWNSTVPAPVEPQPCVHEMIEEWARVQPSAPAVCAWDGELTYGELDELSTKLSRRLVQLGIGPDVLVPLCFEKSMWTTVALLGVLKAGGGFVLLDPSLPEQRLQTIVQQVKARLVVSSASNQALSSRLADEVVTVDLDFVTSDPDKHADQPLSVGPGLSSTLYVVFTSGSTGTPKGVTITHGNMASALRHQTKADFGFTGDLRLFDFASYAFDASVYNAFIALSTGSCLCVPSDQDRKDDLLGSMARLRPNMAVLTPSVTQLLSPEATELQAIMFVGEALHLTEIKRWWDKVQVIHAYGPSECTPCSTINCRATSPEEVTRIGKGAGLVTWIADPENHNKLLPIGCVGELLLEGLSVGPGYLNEPEKTAAVFIEDPDWLLQGVSNYLGRHGRLYKTGDLVRYNGDGSLSFIGRKDTQVKIRGQRVELGEVEHHVQVCIPDAGQVAAEVIVPEGENSRPMLAAFIQVSGDVPETGVSILPIAADIEAKLAEHLPTYMVPTAFFASRQLPITASGKINRKQLRDIGKSFSVQQLAELRKQETRRQPTSEGERQLQRIWSEVLHLETSTIGLDDNFFQLGGDSIAAMKVVAEARKAGIELAVADIFRRPTIEQLAPRESLDGGQNEDDGLQLETFADPIDKAGLVAELEALDIGIRSADVADVLPVTSFQELLVAIRVVNYFYLDLDDSLDISRLEKSCSQVLATYPILRACFFPLLGRIWQIVLEQLDVPIRIHDVDEPLDEALSEFCQGDIQELSPTRPSTAFTLLRHKTEGVRFVLRLAHAQYDAMSINYIFQSLADGYNDEPLAQRPSFSKYLTYASHQRARSMAYWKDLLQGSSLTSVLSKLVPREPPVDPMPKNIQLEADISIPLLPGNITHASLLRSAWAVLLSRITQSHDVAFCHVVGGRNSAVPGVDQIVGNCVNFVPIRVNFASLQTAADLLLTVQQQFIALGEADSMGFRDIIENCTDWPAGSNFDTIVQHLSLDVEPELRFSGASSPVKVFIPPDFLWPCLYIESRPQDGHLHVQFCANTHIMAKETADAVFDGLCRTVDKLANCPEVSLMSYMDDMDIKI